MKTKIVYTIVCGTNNTYLEQTVVSAYSARFHNPEAHIVIVVDDETNDVIECGRSLILDYVTEKISVNPPHSMTKIQKSRWIKTRLREIVSGDLLYIDTDTIIAGPLDDIDKIQDDIAAVRDLHCYYKDSVVYPLLVDLMNKVNHTLTKDDEQFNGGVLYCKDNEIGHELYRNWHRLWIEYLEKYDISIDQPALVCANAESNYPIKHLPDIYNCQVCKNGLKFLFKARIVHYFASNTGLKEAPCSYLFQDDRIFEVIRDLGYIPDSTIELIHDCKSAFPLETYILSDKMYDMYFRESLIPRIIYNYANRPVVYKLISELVDIIMSIGKFFSFRK